MWPTHDLRTSREASAWYPEVPPSQSVVNPLYVVSTNGASYGGAGPGSPAGSVSLRASKYRELVPDNSPFVILKQQALSNGGVGPMHLMAAGPSQPVHMPSHHSPYSSLVLSPSAPVLTLNPDHAWQQAPGSIPTAHDVPLPGFGGNPSQAGYPRAVYPPPAPAAPMPAATHSQFVRINSTPIVNIIPSTSSGNLHQQPPRPQGQTGFMPGYPAAPPDSRTAAPSQHQGVQDTLMAQAEYEATVVTPLLETLTAAHRRQQGAASSAGGLTGGQGTAATPEVQAMHQQITHRLGQLYIHFKEMHDKDKDKLREVSTALQESETRVASLRERNKQLAMAAEQERSSNRPQTPTRQAQRANGASTTAKTVTNILFLPYSLHPHARATRWFGLLLASYRAKRTTWLAITWTVVFFLALGLLIGLLVPWQHKQQIPHFAEPPMIVNMSATAMDMRLRLDKPADVYFAAIPTSLISPAITRRLLEQLRVQREQEQTAAPAAGLSWHARWLKHIKPFGHTPVAGDTDKLRQDTGSPTGASFSVGHRRHRALLSQAPTVVSSTLPVAPPWPPWPPEPLTDLPPFIGSTSPPPPPSPSPSPPQLPSRPPRPPAPPPPTPPPPNGLLSWADENDIVSLALGKDRSSLQRYATACGTVYITPSQASSSYNMSITTMAPTWECRTSLSAPSGRAGPGAAGQCRRCGYVQPFQEAYTVLLVAVDVSGKIYSSVQVLEIGVPVSGQVQVRVNGVLSTVTLGGSQ